MRWIPDTETYAEIQELLPFLDFVTMLDQTTEEQFNKAVLIEELIKNINNPHHLKQWCVCFDIADWYMPSDGHGNYLRKWWVFYENNVLEVSAETYHTDDHHGHYGNDFYYFACIHFDKEISCKRKYMDKPIKTFVKNAFRYKEYITEKMNEIEVDIDIW